MEEKGGGHVHQRKGTGRAMSMPGGVALGATIGFLITVTASAVLAKLTELEKLEWENIGYYIMAVLLGTSFLGAMVAATKIKRQLLPVCAATGGLYYGILLLTTAVFFGGQYHAAGVTGLLIFGGSICAALLLMYRKGKTGKRKPAIHR